LCGEEPPEKKETGIYIKPLARNFKEKTELFNSFKMLPERPFDPVKVFSLSHDSKILALGYENDVICVYDLEGCSELIYRYENRQGLTFLFCPKMKNHIISGYKNGLVILHDLKKSEICASYSHEAYLEEAKISKNNRYITSIHRDNKIVIFDMQEKKIICKIHHDHTNPNREIPPIDSDFLIFSSDSRYVSFGCSCGKVIIYDIETEKTVSVFAHEKSVNGLLFSQDNKRIFVSADKVDKVIEIDIEGAFFVSIRGNAHLTTVPNRRTWWWEYEPGFYVRSLKKYKDNTFLMVTGTYDIVLYNMHSREVESHLDYFKPYEEVEEEELQDPVEDQDIMNGEEVNEFVGDLIDNLRRVADEFGRIDVEDDEEEGEEALRDGAGTPPQENQEEELEAEEDEEEEGEDLHKITCTFFSKCKKHLLVFGKYYNLGHDISRYSFLDIVDINSILDKVAGKIDVLASFDFDEKLYGLNVGNYFFSKSGRFFAFIGKFLHVFDLEELCEVYRYRLGYNSDARPSMLDVSFDGNFTQDMDKLIIVNNNKLTLLKSSSDLFIKEKVAMARRLSRSFYRKRLFSLTDTSNSEEESREKIKDGKKFTDVIIKTVSERAPEESNKNKIKDIFL